MFFDIGSLEFLFLIVLAILVFGPEKLPKMIQDAARVLRKIREFSDSAKQDIRSELGPEFKDFEFEDLNPRRFAQKHLLDNDELGLKELSSDLDMRKELTEVADAVNGRPARPANGAKGKSGSRLSKGLGKGGATASSTGTATTSPAAAEDAAATGAATETAKTAGTEEGSPTGSGPVRLGKDGDTPRETPPPFDADAT